MTRGRTTAKCAAGLVLSLSAPAAAQSWTFLGPAPTTGYSGATGRVSAVVTSPTNANLYYIAGADGGVWRTTDAGQTWTPLTNDLPASAIGALTLDPTNESIIYAGSGEANFANHSRYGLGLYKSTDAGDTWSVLAADTFGGRCFSRIVINPQNPQVLYAAITQAGGFPQRAAAKNHPLASGPRGIFRSSDGGQTWTRFENLPDLCATDLAIDPQNPSTLYAAFGHIFGNPANGIYKTTDAGQTWARLAGGLPTTSVGRISLAIAPSQASRLYALITRAADGTGGGATALGAYTSGDSGQTWTLVSSSIPQATYGWYLSVIAVHPTQPQLAVFGGLDLVRYTAGAWSNITPPHVDLHAAAWDAAGRLIVGCDGGIYSSPDNGANWVSRNAGLGLIQFYAGLSTHPTDPEVILGGMQDNGTARRGSTSLTWSWVSGGDGGWTQINQQNPSIAFAESQGTANLYRSTNGGQSFVGAGSGITGRNCFLPPYLIDPANPARMLYATERLFQSTNGGTSWSTLSPDLTSGTPYAIRAIAIAPSDSRYVYAATNDGRILSSSDSGATFAFRLSDAGTYPRVTRELTVDPADPLTVYHAGWTFGPAPRLRRSRDGGATWERLDSNLPDIPINVVAVDPCTPLATIFVGADDGLYRSINDGQSWRRYGSGFPRCVVIDLILDPARDRLIAATQGRGAWSAPITYCYPDINDDGALNIADFTAFLQAFAFASPQANCDQSTQPPVLNIADFTCMLQRFAAGCL
jgi:photosystem II stability/assembly factor-like uncharacterized protein